MATHDKARHAKKKKTPSSHMVHGPLHEIDDAEMNLGRDLPRVAMSFNVRQDNYHTRLRSINFLPRNYSAVKSSNLLSLVSS